MGKARFSLFAGAALGLTVTFLGLHNAPAQALTPPEHIPAPPIPAPPRLGPQPKIDLPPASTPPGRPVITIPAVAELPPIAIPPQAPMTEADKTDPAPAPLSGLVTGTPPIESPGAQTTQEVLYIIDPGSSQISPAAENKLQNIALTLKANKAARLEVRIFSPSKPRAESAARRLSLARFLAIRDFLVKNGVEDNRIDGRSLISAPDEVNADRVELYIEQ
jgi:hypothetical protein